MHWIRHWNLELDSGFRTLVLAPFATGFQFEKRRYRNSAARLCFRPFVGENGDIKLHKLYWTPATTRHNMADVGCCHVGINDCFRAFFL